MNGIVEHVAKAIVTVEEDDKLYLSVRTYNSVRARAAIKATLEYLSENVSQSMEYKGCDESPMNYHKRAGDSGFGAFIRCGVSSDDAGIIFKAMLSQALKELDQPKGDK